ncbi:MAG TPA: vitamin K epoxide reductase family protein [Friedmanniella sp.]
MSDANVRRRVEPSLVVALLGLVVSAYLTVEHFTSPALLACPEGATINCAKVTSSVWSSVLGVPVALLGLLFFVVMALLVSPPAWHRRALDPVRVVGAVAGVVMALYLVWVELFRVDALCLWCTGAHLCALALLATVLWRVSARDAAPAGDRSAVGEFHDTRGGGRRR